MKANLVSILSADIASAVTSFDGMLECTTPSGIVVHAANQPLPISSVLKTIEAVLAHSPALADNSTNAMIYDIFKVLASPYRAGFVHVVLNDEQRDVTIMYIDASESITKCDFQYCIVNPDVHDGISAMIAEDVKRANGEALIDQISFHAGAADIHTTWLKKCTPTSVGIYQNMSHMDAETQKVSLNVTVLFDPTATFAVDSPVPNMPHSEGLTALLISNDLNDTVVSTYVNNIAGADSEGVINAIAETIAIHRNDIGGMAHGLLVDDDIAVDGNTYSYYMHAFGNGLREILLLKNASTMLRDAIKAQHISVASTSTLLTAMRVANDSDDGEGCFQDQEPSVKLSTANAVTTVSAAND